MATLNEKEQNGPRRREVAAEIPQDLVTLDDLDVGVPRSLRSLDFSPDDWREITVLSFNAGVRPSQPTVPPEGQRSRLFRKRPAIEPRDPDPDRLKALATVLKRTKADVLALQGLHETDELALVRQLLRSTHPNAAVMPGRDPSQRGNGLLVLSRFPFWSTDFEPFGQSREEKDLFPEKGVLWIGIDAGVFGRFWVATFDAALGLMTGQRDLRTATKMQERFIQSVVESATARANGFPVMLLGHIDHPSRHPPNSVGTDPYVTFVQSGLIEAFESVSPGYIDHRWRMRRPGPVPTKIPARPRPPRESHVFLVSDETSFVRPQAVRTLLHKANNKLPGDTQRPISKRNGVLVTVSRRFGSGTTS